MTTLIDSQQSTNLNLNLTAKKSSNLQNNLVQQKL